MAYRMIMGDYFHNEPMVALRNIASNDDLSGYCGLRWLDEMQINYHLVCEQRATFLVIPDDDDALLFILANSHLKKYIKKVLT